MGDTKLGLKVRPSNTHQEFSKWLYGWFFENLGTVLHGGLWVGKDSEIENVCGIRKDVLDAFKRAGISLVRLPGGDYADNYHWMDGIGEPSQRPVRYNGNWRMNDDNCFGTHEFMAICEYLNADPHFVVNLGTGSVEEARAWVEYCNHPGGTELSELRKKNGQEKPFNVKLWAVGNEPFNRGGLMRADYYADMYRNYAYFMRLMDPSIELVMPASFTDPYGWNERVLEVVCRGHRPPMPEHISLHSYWGWECGYSQGYSDEEYYKALAGLDTVRDRLHAIAALCANYTDGDKKIRLSIDEYACWCKDAVDPTLFQHCTQRDALIAARMLQYVAKMGDAVSMMCVSEGINSLLALVFTDGKDMCCTPAFYSYEMLKGHIGGEMLDILENVKLEAVGPKKDATFVTSLATKKGNEITVSMVNASLDEDVEVTIQVEDGVKQVDVTVLETDDVHNENLPGLPEKISPKRHSAKVDAEGTITLCLPRCSVVVCETVH